MGYNTLSQQDHQDGDDRDSVTSASPPNNNRPRRSPVSPPRASLFLDDLHDANTSNERFYSSASSNGFSNLVQSIASGRTNTSYDMLEEEDFAADAPNSPILAGVSSSGTGKIKSSDEQKQQQPIFVHRPSPRRRRLSPPATTGPRSRKEAPTLRTVSSAHSVVALRHPTPDLQTLQGAYTGNVEHLERTAERLSMTSSIEDAIKELHDEQKRSDSRRSSLLESQGIAISRQVSNASSIVEVNSAARSGGFSPAGFLMSPGGSITGGSGRGRSASKSSRFGSRPEPELEGRPLDAFVGSSAPNSPLLSRSISIPEASPRLLRTDSIPEQDEESTLTQPMLQPIESPIMEQEPYTDQDRPRSPASLHTLDKAPSIFADFDGLHVEHPQEQLRSVSGQQSNVLENTQKRVSSANRSTMMERPQSYADPLTGQQMVYYPAPVPMMLNLPQKLSKNPSSMARNKRRTQVLSTLPPVARKSAIWLPDVLEIENEPELAPNDPAQQQEYIPQHQRTLMGGRRHTQDISHMPPQLRASTFFDLPAPAQMVEVKEQSPMATLDSILDASAFAPVNAFTDHAFAGRLGAEVYGKENKRNSKSAANLLEVPKQRNSTFGALMGRRASSSNLLESDKEKRRATMSGLIEGNQRQPIDSDDSDEDKDAEIMRSSDNEDYEDEQEEVYHGPPTTLLAELQLRKQQQKQRTRPLTTAFPNGVHSTLLELDAVAQVEQKTRKQKRVNLAWEDPTLQEIEDAANDDEDVPLGLLYSKKHQDRNRPMGLMERRDMEDNEPLSKRRDRLLGVPPQARQMPRASTMMNLSTPAYDNEDETLAQRVRRLKDEQRTSTGLPAARPVSGDFASEMMSQLGGDALKDVAPKSRTPAGEVEETLGQRRKRLQAEREARALEVGGALGEERPPLKARHSMADLLQAHPSAGSADRATSHQKPATGLLALHEKEKTKRASTMMGLNTQAQRAVSGGLPRSSTYGNNMYAAPQQQVPQFAQPTVNGFGYGGGMSPGMVGGYGGFPQGQQMVFQNPYAMNMGMNMNMNMGYMNGMAMNGVNMAMVGVEPLNQGQIDMVERWRQSVMQ